MTVMGPQMAVTEPLPYFLPPVIGNGSGSSYLRQVKRGNIIWGGGRRGTPQVDPPRARPIPEHLPAQWAGVLRLVPGLCGVQIIRTWSGIEGYIDDGLPIMGPSESRPGLFHLFGFCGHGFQLGPGAGAVAAEYVANGASRTPIEDFAISRFSAGNGSVTVKANDGD